MLRAAIRAHFILPLSFLLASGGSAYSQSAILQGTVVELTSGQPVPGVQMIFSGPAGYFRVASNSAGRFAITDIAPGEYKIEATLDGYYWIKNRSGPSSITVAGNMRNVELRLQVVSPN
jgi:hypothetical protein